MRRQRVLLSDARDNGRYLRTTWHPNRRVFVVSTWVGDVCTGSVQVPTAEAPALANLLVEGLADAATAPPPTEPTSEPTAARGNQVAARLRSWLGQAWGRGPGRGRGGKQGPGATVHLLNVRPR